jgi:hypothetical protein
MDGFDGYKLFVGIRNHFTTDSYDFVKYQGKTKVTYAAYAKRKDLHRFEKLARQSNAKMLLVSSFIEGCHWINDIVGDKGYDAMIKHQKYLEATAYNFKNELQDLPQPLGNLVGCKDGTPKLAQLYFQKKVSLETLVLIDNLVDFVSIWRDNQSSDPLISALIKTICKYRPFVEYDKEKIKQIFVDFYTNR